MKFYLRKRHMLLDKFHEIQLQPKYNIQEQIQDFRYPKDSRNIQRCTNQYLQCIQNLDQRRDQLKDCNNYCIETEIMSNIYYGAI